VTVTLHYSSLERTTRYSVDYKQKTEGPQPSLCVKIWRSVVFVIAPVLFLHSCFSHEAETWRRTASLALSATEKYCVSVLHIYIYIYIINQEACLKDIKSSTIQSFHWWYRIFHFVTGLGTVCNSLSIVVLDIISFPFRFLRHEMPTIREF
jgi:hypothetical protein